MGEIKKGGEEFFPKKIRGQRVFFSIKKEGEDFFSLKIKGVEDFFQANFFQNPT